MGTLASELGPVANRLSPDPRVYADANVPVGLVAFMRSRLHWDVFFVMEHEELRRAPDIEHFRLARQLRRTLITLDRDYLDDRRFPLAECAGVLVVSAANEMLLAKLLSRLDRDMFRPRAPRRRSRRRRGRGDGAGLGLSPGEDGLARGLGPGEGHRSPGDSESRRAEPAALPLEGRKLHVHPDWPGERVRR